MVALLCMWPEVWRIKRMALPLLPFLWLFLFRGADWLLRGAKVVADGSGRLRAMRVCLAIAIGGLSVWSLDAAIRKSKTDVPKWTHFYAVLAWANVNTPENSVIMSRKPFLTYFLANRRSVRIPPTQDRDAFYDVMLETGVTHVIFDTLGIGQTNEFLVPRLMEAPGIYRLGMLTDSPPVSVYEYMPPNR